MLAAAAIIATGREFADGARRGPAARAASRTSSVTARGAVTWTACGASTSTTWAPARRAMKRSLAVPMAWSAVATRYQEGMVRQAADRAGSVTVPVAAG